MSQATTPLPGASPRLVRFIAGLGLGPAALSREQYARRLGQLFDLHDSIAIAAVHGGLPAAIPAGPAPAEVTALFLEGRGAILRAAVLAFDPQGRARIRFPCADPQAPPTAAAVEPYLAFYRVQQSEAEHRIRRLQAQVRQAASGRSPQLDERCALDAVVARSMAARARGFFSTIPGLLQIHFEQLQAACTGERADEHESARGWRQALQQFRRDMQGMLLAEIETRLLPVTGLVEAVAAHQTKETHD